MAANDVTQLNPPTIEQIEARSCDAVSPPGNSAQRLFDCAYGDGPVAPVAVASDSSSKAPLPPVDLFKSERSDIPCAPEAKEREQFKQLETALITQLNRTAPVARGEGYYQVLQRMHKDWTPEQLYDQAHRIKNINHNDNELRVGQRLSTISDWEKEHAVKERMTAFEKASPEERKRMIDEVRKQIVPDAPVSRGHGTGHGSGHGHSHSDGHSDGHGAGHSTGRAKIHEQRHQQRPNWTRN